MSGKASIFCIIAFMLFIFCNKKEQKESIAAESSNIDSIFIKRYLPEIRDALCSDTLTIQKVKSIFKKTINFYEDGDQYLSLDSNDTGGTHCFNHIRASISVDSVNRDIIRRIVLRFPSAVCLGDSELITLFGTFTPDKTPTKAGTYGTYEFGSECKVEVVIVGLFFYKDCIKDLIMLKRY